MTRTTSLSTRTKAGSTGGAVLRIPTTCIKATWFRVHHSNRHKILRHAVLVHSILCFRLVAREIFVIRYRKFQELAIVRVNRADQVRSKIRKW